MLFYMTESSQKLLLSHYKCEICSVFFQSCSLLLFHIKMLNDIDSRLHDYLFRDNVLMPNIPHFKGIF